MGTRVELTELGHKIDQHSLDFGRQAQIRIQVAFKIERLLESHLSKPRAKCKSAGIVGQDFASRFSY